MFRRTQNQDSENQAAIERVTSVLGNGINLNGKITGKGGVRIEGIFEGEIKLRGLIVVGETGKVTCENLRANTVIIAGAMHGGITADKLEIRSTGRVWGNVTVAAFTTEEGAFLRGQVTMQDHPELDIENELNTSDQGIQIQNIDDPAEPKS
jgi:cytoskeletal protein CcmA (bactofilin family)